MTKFILLLFIIIILIFLISKSNEHFRSCGSKHLTEVSPAESYNNISKGWCKTNISNRPNLKANTIDELNYCYGETKDEYGNISFTKSKGICNTEL